MEALLEAAVRLAAPLLIAALGELVVERAGVVNIGIEGLMLIGAFAAFAGAVAFGSPLAGIVVGVAAASLASALFGLFAVVRKADQIVVGTAINLLALGATGLGLRSLFADGAATAPILSPLPISGLASLPGIGAPLFQQTAFVYAAGLLALGVWIFLYRTREGLRLRAVGELARAADAEGVRVTAVRFGAVLFGGACAGLAGAVLTLAQSNTFTEGMTSGRGFIALAIVIFGRWSPVGVVLAALFFGAANALQFRLQARGVGLPYPLFLMFPYVVTLAVLAFSSGRARAPADLGRPYRRKGSPWVRFRDGGGAMTSEFDEEGTSGARKEGTSGAGKEGTSGVRKEGTSRSARGGASAGGQEPGRREAQAADESPLLPVLQKNTDHPCFQCAKCCTYVAVEVDGPRTMKEYDHIIWYLYHEGVSVFVDFEGDWYIKYETRCRHLSPQGLCGVYDRRPGICKDFDWRDCENTIRDEPADKLLFESSDAFMAWFEEKRPKTFRRYQRFLRRKHKGTHEPELGRVSQGRAKPS